MKVDAYNESTGSKRNDQNDFKAGGLIFSDIRPALMVNLRRNPENEGNLSLQASHWQAPALAISFLESLLATDLP